MNPRPSGIPRIRPKASSPDGAQARALALDATFLEVLAVARSLRSKQEGQSGEAATRILLHLERGGEQSVPQIARAHGVTRQYVQTLVNELRARELVLTTPNPAHKRSPLVGLTDSGKWAAQVVLETQRVFLSHLDEEVSEARLRSAASVLRRIVRALRQANRA